jgi:peptidoglycan/xylan/chitin deacetylase (PgdA/CDA1 family)
MTHPLNIFMYHRILPTASREAVSTANFRRQLNYIQRHYSLLKPADLLPFLDGQYPENRPAALITFDDGWLDNWLYATPILKEFRVQAILALSTGYLHDGPVRGMDDASIAAVESVTAYRQALHDSNNSAFINRSEAAALLDSGCWQLQAHGHLHARTFGRLDPDATRYPDGNNWSLTYALNGHPPVPGVPSSPLVSALAQPRTTLDAAYLEALKSNAQTALPDHGAMSGRHPLETLDEFQSRLGDDLSTCRREIKNLTGHAPNLLFWPWGHYSKESLSVAREQGFSHTLTVRKGPVLPGHPYDSLPRIGVSNNWRHFTRNAWTFRHPLATAFRDMTSPSKPREYDLSAYN